MPTYSFFLTKNSENVTKLIKFKQMYCILQKNKLKYILGEIWKSPKESHQKNIIKNGGFLLCQ